MPIVEASKTNYTALKPDINRGMLIRRHKESGMYGYMYKDEPGIYVNGHGLPISEKLAKEMGFDVEAYKKERIRRERKETASKIIDRELLLQTESNVVLAERGGFQVIDYKLGRAMFRDAEGNNYTPQPVPVEVAMKLLDAMAPEETPPPKAPAEGKAKVHSLA